VTNLVTFEDYKVVLITATQELSTVWDSYSQIVDNFQKSVVFSAKINLLFCE